MQNYTFTFLLEKIKRQFKKTCYTWICSYLCPTHAKHVHEYKIGFYVFNLVSYGLIFGYDDLGIIIIIGHKN